MPADFPLSNDFSVDSSASDFAAESLNPEDKVVTEVTAEDIADETDAEDDITDMLPPADKTFERSASDISAEESRDEMKCSHEALEEDAVMDQPLIVEQDLADIEQACMSDLEGSPLNPANLPLPASPTASNNPTEDHTDEVSRYMSTSASE